ncbi:MAG: hypothetical protein IKU40_08750 [Clostridia bacterium]|nr:hypothetical protein [Clostridia bacterium]
MASTKIRGITIELGADTSGLSKALKGVNGEIRDTQKQLKDVERLLKLDPGNVELLEQKQRLLGNQVENTSKKLEALKEAQKQVAEEMEKTGEGQEQYDALTREIAATEMQLKEAEKAASSFNATNAKIAASADKLATKFGNVAQKTKRLSQVAGGLLAGMGALAVKTAQEADELNTLSKQTGVSTAELQKMKYAADLIDVDTDTIVGGMKKLKKQLESTNAPFEELGIRTKDAKGEFRDITDIFYDSVKALSEIPNETERDVMAMELFGKSADELAGIIDDGGLALKQLGEEAENLGVIIPQEDIDKANELNDAIDQLKAQASGVFAEIGVEIAEMLLPYLPTIKEDIQAVLEALKGIDPDTLAIGAKCALIVAAISPIASVCASVTTAVSNLSTALGGISIGTGGLIAACVAAVLAFGLFGDKINEVVQDITDNFLAKLATDWSETFDVIGEVLNSWQADIKMVIDWVKDYFQAWVDFYRGLFTGDWARMWKGAQEIVMNTVDGIIMGAKMMVNTLISVLNGLIDGLNVIKLPDFMGGYKVNIPKIPYLAQGGTISSGSAIVGEAGAEILTVSNGSATVTPLGGNGGDSGVVGLLETYLPYLAAGNTIVMDSGALVGSIAPDMNSALGQIAIRGGHR